MNVSISNPAHFHIKLKIDTVNFEWIISKNTINSYLASINFAGMTNQSTEQEIFFDKLITHELTKVLFLELKQLLNLRHLELIGFKDNNMIEIKSSGLKGAHIVKTLDLPIKHLFGCEFTVVTQTQDEMDYILGFLQYKPLQLNKYVKPLTVKFNCWKEPYCLMLESKVATNNFAYNKPSRSLNMKLYIKLSVCINDVNEYIYIERKLIKYIVSKYNGVNQYIPDQDFEYNEFLTGFGLEILQIMLAQISGLVIQILDWQYVELPKLEYLRIKITGEMHTSLVLIPNLESKLIGILNQYAKPDCEADLSVNYAVSDNNEIKIPVLCSQVNLSLTEMRQLKVGDILLLDKDINNRDYFLDLKSSLLVAKFVEESSTQLESFSLQIFGKVDQNE